jgi:disease resistance protein RPM1
VVVKLPVEVTMLPQLAYLFGKFELNNVHHKNRKKLNKFFSEKRSQLRTLGGISVYTTQDLEIVALVVNHAINLKKVKVWFKDTPRSTGPGYSRLVNTLESILIKRSRDLESVSIDFNGVSNNFLDFVKTVCTISSIKLRRVLGCLPARAELEQVRNLKKLHLFSTGCGSEQLGSLQHLKCLQYLKLAEDGHGLWHSAFHLKVGGFISLIWLCFEASNSKHPPLKIDEGVKTPLTSLLLLCKEIHPCRETGELLRVEGISHLPKLSEVILHNSASDDTVKAWKEEAKRHINMPYVEKQQV